MNIKSGPEFGLERFHCSSS